MTWKDLKEEILKTCFVVLIFATVLVLSWCGDALAANGWRPKALCAAPQTVYTSMLDEDFVLDHNSRAVNWWNARLGFLALLDGGRAPLVYGVWDKIGIIGHRAAPITHARSWASAVTYKRGEAIRTFSLNGHCIEGTAVWMDHRCIVPPPRDAEDIKNGCVSEPFLYVLLLHEIGHALGFRHSKQKGTVMYPSISESGTRLVLGYDTLADMVALYPQSIVITPSNHQRRENENR